MQFTQEAFRVAPVLSVLLKNAVTFRHSSRPRAPETKRQFFALLAAKACLWHSLLLLRSVKIIRSDFCKVWPTIPTKLRTRLMFIDRTAEGNKQIAKNSEKP
jgi:hypothetical protein